MLRIWNIISKNYKLCRRVVFSILFIEICLFSSQSVAIGLNSIPVLNQASVTVNVEQTGSGTWCCSEYKYTYTIANPVANTGEIWSIKIDVSSQWYGYDQPSERSFPVQGGDARVWFHTHRSNLDSLSKTNVNVTPIGQNAPLGWNGGFGRDGFAVFANTAGTPNISPGNSQGGFEVIARRVPTLREIILVPEWIYEMEDHGTVTKEMSQEAAAIMESLPQHVTALGPAPFTTMGHFTHWDQVRDDITKMGELNWISSDIAITLSSQLATARNALDSYDGTLAKVLLQPFAETIAQADQSQLNDSSRLLLELNATALLEGTYDTTIDVEPEYVITPLDEMLTVGEQYVLTVKVINKANNNEPLPDMPLYFIPTDGSISSQNIVTDSSGIAAFKYTSSGEMSFSIDIYDYTYENKVGSAEVTWSGGIDLVVPLFIPPVISTEAGNTVFISDTTMNIGNIPAPPSTTYYYLSDQDPVNPETSIIIGKRSISSLQPGEGSNSIEIPYVIPEGIAEGVHFMLACADAEANIAEINDENNCSTSRLDIIQTISVPVALEEIVNLPPDCSQATASPFSNWPPNHDIIDPVNIVGITDPDGDPLTILITSIEQDEPVNHLGDGSFLPDGFGLNTSQASVRRERSALEDGRIYEIGFTATDDKGASCDYSVMIGVPHDQGKHPNPIDSGIRYDSTQQ
jgi:hypothetical protein